MTHPLVVALFPSVSAAATATRALHAAGITREDISIVARNHDEEGALADQMDATPGTDIEDSRLAARFGELSGQVLAAIALVLPGIGPIVAAGPLSAGLGEAAGHVAGGVASALANAGIPADQATALQRAVEDGAVLIGVHATSSNAAAVRDTFERSGATRVDIANWAEGAS